MSSKKSKYEIVESSEDNNENEESILRQLVSKYLPYWPMFLLSMAIAVGGAYAYILYTTPKYKAVASLIIKDEKKGNEDSKITESLDPFSSKTIVENEVEVIKSRKLITDVINKLGLYAPISEHRGIKTVSAYLTSPLSVIAANPDSLTEFQKIKLDIDKNKQEVILDDQHRYPVNQMVTTPYGQLEFIANKNYKKPEKPLKQLYFALINPEDLAPILLGILKVEASSKLSSLINVSYIDEVPKRAQQILNQLLASYEESGFNEKSALAKNTLAFVEDRLNLVSADLNSIEKKVEEYKSGKGAVDIGTQGQLFLQNVSANDQKLSDVNTQLSVLEQVEKFVTADKNSGIIPSTLGINDLVLTEQINKLYSLELDYERLRKTVGENNPSIIAIQDQINKLKPGIIQNIQSQQQGLNATKQNITSTNSGYNSLLQAVPLKERQLLDITREQQIKSQIYSFLLQKREESQLAYASTVSNNRIVDNAHLESRSPVRPRKMIIYFLAVVASFSICSAIVAVRESLTGKVLYRSEVETRTAIPIIGEIAFNKSKKSLLLEAGERSFIAEEFRRLRMSLSYLHIDSEHKKILVTSSISGEGKSFIATNLAISLSLTGKKVALVDIDLNNPTVSKLLGVAQENGITQFLNGEKSIEEIIKPVDEREGLFFISAGNLPDNPTELLSNGKVKEIIEYLDKNFDRVIIDTSPSVLVTDAYILSPLCNATLYVVRHKHTPKILIKRIDERNEVNPITNPAIIFNGVKLRGFFKNNYGYGYDYVYGNKEKRKRDKKTKILKIS